MTKRKINDIEDNDPQEEFYQIKEDLLAGEPFYIKSPDDNLYPNDENNKQDTNEPISKKERINLTIQNYVELLSTNLKSFLKWLDK